MGEIIDDPEKVRRLRETLWVEVKVYSPMSQEPFLSTSEGLRGKVRAGPASKSGYKVDGGAYYLPRELYVMELSGDTDAFLGRIAENRSIYKIGLSASPDLRRQAFQKSLPQGAFYWQIERTSRKMGIKPIRDFDAAVAGENAMKDYLVARAEWLGGEFYLASKSDIDAA